MNAFDPDDGCGCEPLAHPPLPVLPSGLPVLTARQWAGFPDYRAAMLRAIARFPELSDWRAQSEGDLGVMLLEAWAIVLDTTGFYDARVAERSYLPTAPDADTAAALTHLIGYQRRPAMAARVSLAVTADGHDPVTLPTGTAFRSSAFDDQPPQVFELTAAAEIWPQRNQWALAPIRQSAFDGTLRFLPRRAPNAGAVVVLSRGPDAAVARVEALVPESAPDGQTYERAVLEGSGEDHLAALCGLPRNEITVAILRQPFAQSPLVVPDVAANERTVATQRDTVVLDALYPQLQSGGWAAAEIGGSLQPIRILSVGRTGVVVDEASGATMPLSTVRFSPALIWGQSFVLHAMRVSLGTPTRVAETRVGRTDLQTGGVLVPPVQLGDAPGGGTVIAQGQQTAGVAIDGTVLAEPDGAARFHPGGGLPDFPPLSSPVSLLGNVVVAVRGESVVDEVLGSADAATPFNAFVLKQQPLTWVEEASAVDGRRPALSVRVDGQIWARVPTFFDRGADERIYTVHLEPDGSTRIQFGDGVRGARPNSGVDNVRADYRFGAGAAKPPPGSIDQIAVQTPGLASVQGPLPAVGGADAEPLDGIRDTAPAATLTLGRAVSLDDFTALARRFAGVLNAQAAWVWEERRQRAGVTVWVIVDGGDLGDALAGWLRAQAAPGLSISVVTAQPVTPDNLAISLAISLAIDPAHDVAAVRLAAVDALHDPDTGLLAPRNQTIGGAIFRSALTHRLHAVAGVVAVQSILLNGVAMPTAVAAGQGRWFDLAAGTTIT